MKVAELAEAKEEIAKLKEQVKEKDAHIERIELEMRRIEGRMEGITQIRKHDTMLRRPELNELNTSKSKTTRYHEVRRGETLSGIADKHAMRIQELCRLNEIIPSTIIRPGDMLLISSGN